MVQHLKKLQEIDLSGCTAVTQSGFLELLQLRQLSRVSLRATHVTDYAISNLILVLEGLLFLDISSCPKVTNQCLVNLNALLKCRVVPHPGPHIEALPLMMNIMASCVSLGTAASMVLELVPSFTGSEELGPLDSVDSLSLSTDFGGGAPSRMSTFGDEFTEVELAERESHLPNMGPPPLASASDKADGTDAFSHIRFRLQSLIMRNVNVNYILMMYIARFFPDLRRLDLSGSRHLNTLPFRDLALACTTLESLEFRDCARVNDESLIHVFSSLSRHSLTRLNLFGCHLVSDASLVYLFNNCTRIRSLNIVDCAHITNMCLTKLTQLPLLTRLDVGNSCTTASQINPGISPLGISLFMNARGCSYGLITLRLYAGTADDLVLSVISQRCHNLKVTPCPVARPPVLFAHCCAVQPTLIPHARTHTRTSIHTHTLTFPPSGAVRASDAPLS